MPATRKVLVAVGMGVMVGVLVAIGAGVTVGVLVGVLVGAIRASPGLEGWDESAATETAAAATAKTNSAVAERPNPSGRRLTLALRSRSRFYV